MHPIVVSLALPGKINIHIINGVFVVSSFFNLPLFCIKRIPARNLNPAVFSMVVY